MKIFLSSLSSYVDDGCDEYLRSKNKTAALLGSNANDRAYINYIYEGNLKSCERFMLDSGAVSARSGKKEVTFDSYIEMLYNLPEDIPVPQTIIGFDVIGDPIKSMENYKKMKYDHGIDFMPVFHFRSDMKYLEELIKEGWTYIGLGGTASKAHRKRVSYEDFINWWEDVFFIIDNEGQRLRYPDIKFHGFAVTSKRAINMFPWESVDSTAWIKNAAVGKVLTPWGDTRISTERSGGCRLQLKRRDPNTQEKVRNWIESLGFTLEQVQDDRLVKNYINIEYFLWLQESHNWQMKKVLSQSFLNYL